MNAFEIGKVYYATPALEGLKKKIVVVIGRESRLVQVAIIGDLDIGEARTIEGREFMQLNTKEGVYNVSSVCEASAADAALINSILENGN